MILNGFRSLSLAVLAVFCLATAPALAQAEPEVLFDEKTVGEDEEIILLHNYTRMFIDIADGSMMASRPPLIIS